MSCQLPLSLSLSVIALLLSLLPTSILQHLLGLVSQSFDFKLSDTSYDVALDNEAFL